MKMKTKGEIIFPYCSQEYECWCKDDNILLLSFGQFVVEYHKNEGRFELYSEYETNRTCLYTDYPNKNVKNSRYAFGDLEINLIKMEIQDLVSSGIFLEDDMER